MLWSMRASPLHERPDQWSSVPSAWLLVAPCVALAVTLLVGHQTTPGAEAVSAERLRELELRLDSLRQRWNVPGMSGAMASANAVVWTRGFGEAERARRQAMPDTVYHLASLTKPFAAALLLQLVDEGKLSLETPVTAFGIDLPPATQVVHLLTHTSDAVPGTAYRYDGARFSQLDRVIEKLTGSSFATAVSDRMLRPLKLEDTSPNPLAPASCAEAGRDPAVVIKRMAQGYDSDGRRPVEYRAHFSSAAGLVSTASDMARFSMAWDSDALLRPATRARAYSAWQSPSGKPLAYGLGWFVLPRRSDRLIWHYGWWAGSSTLIVKLPERQLTFVLLANSDGLSREFDLGGDNNVRRSPFAKAFLDIVADR